MLGFQRAQRQRRALQGERDGPGREAHGGTLIAISMLLENISSPGRRAPGKW